MKSKKYLRIAAYVMVILIFNLIFFLMGGEDRTAVSWIAYVFVYIAIVVSFVAPLYCINYKRIPENLVAIYGFAWLYTLISIVMNVVFMKCFRESMKSCLILNIVLLVIYFIQLIINLNVNYAVERNLETMDAEREFVKGVSAKIKVCMTMVKDQEVRKVLEKAYDIVRTSPLHSKDECMDYEVEVIRLANELEVKVDQGAYAEAIDIANQIIKNTKKRNALL